MNCFSLSTHSLMSTHEKNWLVDLKKQFRTTAILITLLFLSSLPCLVMAQDGGIDVTFNAGNPVIEPVNNSFYLCYSYPK
jgi:hypothetical protein